MNSFCIVFDFMMRYQLRNNNNNNNNNNNKIYLPFFFFDLHILFAGGWMSDSLDFLFNILMAAIRS